MRFVKTINMRFVNTINVRFVNTINVRFIKSLIIKFYSLPALKKEVSKSYDSQFRKSRKKQCKYA